MTTLIIARHGNTFSKGETPTRVGARTDIPLVASGQEQASLLGKYLFSRNLIPEVTYSAPLKRTMETAQGALKAMNLVQTVKTLDIFTEIDYGPDENKTEEEVVSRIGEDAISAWNKEAIVPEGWQVNPAEIIQNWQDFASGLLSSGNSTVLAVTSNGIARFAPYITGDFAAFSASHDIKVGTGCLCIFRFDGTRWLCDEWNLKPKDFVSL